MDKKGRVYKQFNMQTISSVNVVKVDTKRTCYSNDDE